MIALFASALVVMAGSVGPAHPLRMESGQRFRDGDAVRVWVYVNGREVGEAEGNRCVAYYYSRGTTVRLSSCGAGRVPIKVRATSMRKVRVKVRIGRLP